jgi:hypothetical protein
MSGSEITNPLDMLGAVERLQAELVKMPQYEPETRHHFHGGMYCREVWRDVGVLVVGRVHRKEHFYMVVTGTVLITTDEGVQRVTAPTLLLSKPGARRAVYSETPALCMTFHRTNATTVEDAEIELVEEEENSMYDALNMVKPQPVEVLS